MKNYFGFFGLNEKFEIDECELEAKYFQLQSEFHPDSSNLGDIEKSMLANEAYKNLSDDFLRACHLLKIRGIDILHDEKAVKIKHETLEEIIELQEKISFLASDLKAKNATVSEPQESGLQNSHQVPADLQQIKNKIETDYKSLIIDSMQSFAVNDLDSCAQNLVKARYLGKILKDSKLLNLTEF